MVTVARNLAIKIIDEFEELLGELNIKIPSKDREGGIEEACIYGSEYYQLEDAITEIIENEFPAIVTQTLSEEV